MLSQYTVGKVAVFSAEATSELDHPVNAYPSAAVRRVCFDGKGVGGAAVVVGRRVVVTATDKNKRCKHANERKPEQQFFKSHGSLLEMFVNLNDILRRYLLDSGVITTHNTTNQQLLHFGSTFLRNDYVRM